MKKFDVFQGAEGEVTVIGHGFCWPGFMFSALWLAYKGLWTYALLVLLATLTIVFGLVYLSTLSPAGFNDPAIGWLKNLLQLMLHLMVGWAGNEWLSDKLKKGNFRLKRQIEAENQEQATAMANGKVI